MGSWCLLVRRDCRCFDMEIRAGLGLGRATRTGLVFLDGGVIRFDSLAVAMGWQRRHEGCTGSTTVEHGQRDELAGRFGWSTVVVWFFFSLALQFLHLSRVLLVVCFSIFFGLFLDRDSESTGWLGTGLCLIGWGRDASMEIASGWNELQRGCYGACCRFQALVASGSRQRWWLEVRDGEAEIEPWLFELQVWNRGIKEVGEELVRRWFGWLVKWTGHGGNGMEMKWWGFEWIEMEWLAAGKKKGRKGGHGLNREGKSGGGLVSRGWPARGLAYSC
jgi:hypothetical protein